MPDCTCASDAQVWSVDISDTGTGSAVATDSMVGSCSSEDFGLFAVYVSDDSECY